MKLLQNLKQSTVVFICLLLIFLILIEPVIQVSQYNVPSADDYTYGTNTYQIWKHTNNIFLVIKAAFSEVANTYITWQGTYAAVFLFALQPSIFGLNFYKITSIVLLISFIFANIFFVQTVAKKLFNYNKDLLPYIISLILIIFSLEFIPSPRESIFWWNGSVFYTLFYCIMLITIGILIRLIKSTAKKNIIINTIGALILTIILQGGNYCTALQYLSIITVLTIICFINKNSKKWNILAINVIAIIALGISMIAPGNSIRQANYTDRMDPMSSIFLSLYNGFRWCIHWASLQNIIMFIILIVPIYEIIKESKFNFKYPIVFTIITFGIYASQQVPTIYAMNSLGPLRAINIFYYSYDWFILSNILYYIGWIKNKKGNIKLLDYLNKNILPYILIMILLALCITCAQNTYNKSLTYVSYRSIVTGIAYKYNQEIIERYKIYEDDSITDAIVKPLTQSPSLFCKIDLQRNEDDINYWVNQGVARYFNKNSVNLEND